MPDELDESNTAHADAVQASRTAESYPAEIIPMESELEKELGHLLNRHSAENESGTPDFILAMYLKAQLDLFNLTINQRANWRGESIELPALQQLRRDTSTMDRVIAYLRSKVEEGVIDIKTPIEATDLYRDLMDYRVSAEPSDLQQGGLEAGDTQGPDVDLGKWEPQEDDVIAPGALDANDGKEVPLVTYSDGQRNEIGTVTLHVTPGEVLVTGTIKGATAVFDDPGASYSIDEPKDVPPRPTGRFARYQQEGLSS